MTSTASLRRRARECGTTPCTRADSAEATLAEVRELVRTAHMAMFSTRVMPPACLAVQRLRVLTDPEYAARVGGGE